MAITYDSTGNGSLAGVTITYQVVVANQLNRLLVVSVCQTGQVGGDDVTASGITYDGVALTKIGSQRFNNGGFTLFQDNELWYLLAPNVGTANVVVTLNNAPSLNAYSAAISVYNVKQQAPEDDAKATGASDAPTVNVTPVSANSWIIDNISNTFDSRLPSPAAGQTERYELGVQIRTAGSTLPVAVAALTACDWDLTVSDAWGIIAASFAPQPDFTPVTDTFDAKVINSFDSSGIDTDIYGMTFDGRNLWIIGNSDSVLHQVDRLGNIILEIDLSGIAASITGIAFYNNSLWIYDVDNGYLIHISLAGVVLQTIDISAITADCYDIEFDGKYFWITDETGQEIHQLSIDGVLINSFSATYASTWGICTDGNLLIATSENKRTLEIYNKLGTQIGEFDFDPIDSDPRAICFDGMYYWIAGNENDYIYQVRII